MATVQPNNLCEYGYDHKAIHEYYQKLLNEKDKLIEELKQIIENTFEGDEPCSECGEAPCGCPC